MLLKLSLIEDFTFIILSFFKSNPTSYCNLLESPPDLRCHPFHLIESHYIPMPFLLISKITQYSISYKCWVFFSWLFIYLKFRPLSLTLPHNDMKGHYQSEILMRYTRKVMLAYILDKSCTSCSIKEDFERV